MYVYLIYNNAFRIDIYYRVLYIYKYWWYKNKQQISITFLKT